MTKIFRSFLLVFGTSTFLITIISLFFINFNFGIVMMCCASGFIFFYGLFYEKLSKKKWLTFSILVVFTCFFMIVLFIGIYGKNDNVTFNEDAVIVLGAGIRGEQVSKLLSYRLDKAVEYSSVNQAAVIVVSGGQGPQEDITEALAMERYMVEKGVPKERIIKEEISTSTYENILRSKEILDQLFEDPYETVVITNDFHIYRATKLAEKLEMNVTHYNAKIEWYAIPLNYSRECVAILKMWLFGQ